MGYIHVTGFENIDKTSIQQPNSILKSGRFKRAKVGHKILIFFNSGPNATYKLLWYHF